MVSVVVLQHSEIRQFVQQLVETLVVRRVVLLGVHRVQLRVGVMLADLKEITGQHIKQQVERRLTRHRIHLVLEDTGESPVFRGVGCHLNLTGNTVRHMADELQQFRIGVFVALVLGDKFLRHFRHGIIFS